jgi:hypothetical protein
MRPRTFWSIAYWVLSATQWLGVGLTTLVGGVLKTDPSKWSPVLGEVLGWIQDNSWWLIVTLGGLALLARLRSGMIGAPWVWKTVQRVLEALRKDAFEISEGDPVHAHRVTLFKRARWRWRVGPSRCDYWPWGAWRAPWSGWLVPVVRSGHTTQRSEAVFLAPDDADSGERIAGQVWAQDKTVSLDDLPDLSNNPGEQAILEYAQRAWLPERWVRARLKNRKPFARALCGIPVEVNGKRWGVLILDSRNPTGIRRRSPSGKANERMVRLLLGEILCRRA